MCAHTQVPTYKRYPKHGEVTPIPNAMEINDINNFARSMVSALSVALLNSLLRMRTMCARVSYAYSRGYH